MIMESQPIFSLDESGKAAVTEIVGPEYVDCVEEALLIYSYKKSFHKKGTSIPKMNESLGEVRGHIESLKKIMRNPQLREYMLSISAEYFSDEGGRLFIGERTPFINRTPTLHVFDIDALEKLDKVCEAAINKQTPGPGKPKGQKNEAVHDLLNRLARCCEKVIGKPLTTKPDNLLMQLVIILKKQLELGELSGLTKTIIKERAKLWKV